MESPVLVTGLFAFKGEGIVWFRNLREQARSHREMRSNCGSEPAREEALKPYEYS